MAFLDQKERILDIVLTDKGRDLLSKNQLNFSFYVFSDEGIDYSGSLSSSGMVSSSLDNYIHRDLSFEADQRKNKDLNSFLYTIPNGKRTLPEMRMSVDISSSVTLERRYRIDTIVTENRTMTTVEPPVDVVVRATVPKRTYKTRVAEYVNLQRVKSLIPALRRDFLKNGGK